MSYNLDISVYCGSGNTDESLIVAELREHGDIDDPVIPAAVDTFENDVDLYYFKSLGLGFFSFRCEGIPDNFRGMLWVIYDGVLKSVTAVNPEEAENLDAKISAIPFAVDTALSIEHGFGNWTTTGGGSELQILKVRSSVTLDPVIGAKITIKDSDDTGVIFVGSTGTGGILEVELDPGDYFIHITTTLNYEPFIKVQISVTVPQLRVFELDPIIYVPPPDPAFSRIEMRVIGLNGRPMKDVSVLFHNLVQGPAEVAADDNPVTDSNVFIGFPGDVTGRTDENGILRDPTTGEEGVLILRSDWIIKKADPAIEGNVTDWEITAPAIRFAKTLQVDVPNYDLGTFQ